MRRIGLALLVLSAGCNQVFGIKDTHKEPDAAPPEFTGHMRWAAAKTVGGAPAGVDVFGIGTEAIDSAPLMLQVGPALGTGDLVDGMYEKDTGLFHFGFKLAGQSWRLVYTLPDDTIPHEVQWSVQNPDLVIPRMTRMTTATTMPPGPNTGYLIQPSPATSFTDPYVATSGAFTAGHVPNFSGNQVTYKIATDAPAIDGPISQPEPSDWLFVGDFASATATAQQLVGWGTVSNVTLTASPVLVTPTWNTTPLLAVKPNPGLMPAKTRIRAALLNLDADDSNVEYTFYPHMSYGVSPNLSVYGFSEPAGDCGATTALPSLTGLDCLPQPSMITLADDTAFETSFSAPRLDTLGIMNPPVLYARVTQTRPVHGVSLTSGIQSLVAAPNPLVSGESVEVLSSAVPTAALVDQVKLDSIDLSGASGPVSMDVAVPASQMPRTLTFHPRLGADGAPLAAADDFIVMLYQIQNPDTAMAKLHAVRVYHVTDYTAGVKIDGMLLPAGLYVFAITSRVGIPMANTGDFQTVAYPLGTSTAFSRQFVVQ